MSVAKEIVDLKDFVACNKCVCGYTEYGCVSSEEAGQDGTHWTVQGEKPKPSWLFKNARTGTLYLLQAKDSRLLWPSLTKPLNLIAWAHQQSSSAPGGSGNHSLDSSLLGIIPTGRWRSPAWDNELGYFEQECREGGNCQWQSLEAVWNAFQLSIKQRSVQLPSAGHPPLLSRAKLWCYPWSVFKVFLLLDESWNNVLVLDEPTNHLMPRWNLKRAPERIQVIPFATDFMKAGWIKSGDFNVNYQHKENRAVPFQILVTETFQGWVIGVGVKLSSGWFSNPGKPMTNYWV